jgi:hypothetical protein
MGHERRLDQERREDNGLPIACSLTPAQLAAMREGLLPGLLAGARTTEPVPGGFRWRFEPRAGLVQEAAAVIEAEHRCCPFLRFVLSVDPGDGPVTIEVTGPEGTREFLSSLLGAPPGPSGR